MTAVLITGVVVLVALLAVVVRRRRRTPRSGRVVGRDRLRVGADPYAAQRHPEKLNPGLGYGCTSGGGGV